MKSAVAADRLSVAPATEIASPDRNVRWRIVAANRVERSIDGGTTWQVQPTGYDRSDYLRSSRRRRRSAGWLAAAVWFWSRPTARHGSACRFSKRSI
jgi:hypothetical protein